jgi:hypothetical protein
MDLLINQNHLKRAKLTGVKESRKLPQTKNPYLDMNIFFTGQYIGNIVKLGINLPLFVIDHFCKDEIKLFEDN